jgi:hypothetical protein
MVHGATEESIRHSHERPVEEREQPHNGGIERKEGELGWKIEVERPKHKGRTRPERRSHSGKLGDGGQWGGHCHL